MMRYPPETLTGKILRAHCVQDEAGVLQRPLMKADSVLFHDMSGILAFMGYDAMGMERSGVEKAVVFTDHNLVSVSHSTADDQAFVRSGAKAFGMHYSMAGNGICHSLYLERIGRPGMLLIGADSHTATCGALGMIGIGMGGMDTAVAMSGLPMRMAMPKVMEIRLCGRLSPGVSAKDAALVLLSRLTISGAVGMVLEYTGEGAAELTVPQRATIANMGAEMGATSSIFPADEQVRKYLAAQGREEDFIPLCADAGAQYDAHIELNLSEVVPMAALPGKPDHGRPISELERTAYSQIFIGSCTNGSYTDLVRAALILQGRKVHPDTTLLVSCGSRQVYSMLLRDGYIAMMTEAGARILECGCGPCMGIGHAPESGAQVLRTTNRNFRGRSGTPDAGITLCSTETAAASAIAGRLTAAHEVIDPKVLAGVCEPDIYPVDDSMLIDYGGTRGALAYSDHIRPIPVRPPMEDTIRAAVSLKAGDGISTDDIVPAIPQAMALRANIPALSAYIFRNLDPGFAIRCREMGQSIIIAGSNYAQGSSREHAAIGCMELGVRMVLAISMHRIHRANLINYGVVPLLFEKESDYSAICQGDLLEAENVISSLRQTGRVTIRNLTAGKTFTVRSDLQADEIDLLDAGGLLPMMARRAKAEVNG